MCVLNKSDILVGQSETCVGQSETCLVRVEHIEPIQYTK